MADGSISLVPEGRAIPPSPAYAVVTWEQLHRDARSLAASLVNHQFTGIVAVSRGGLIPAAIVARELECRLVETISVISYAAEAGSAGAPRIIKPAAAAGDGTGFLIVDDLVDRGDTARAVRAALPNAFFACLYAKPAGRACTDLFVAEVPQETWILFPWDTAPLFVPPLRRAEEATPGALPLDPVVRSTLSRDGVVRSTLSRDGA